MVIAVLSILRSFPSFCRKYIKAYRLIYTKKSSILRSGVLIHLPNGVWKDRMVPTMILNMRRYFDDHAERWYNHYADSIPKGRRLQIVNTSYKCSAWAHAICSTESPDEIFARLYQPFPYSEISYQWDKHDEVRGKSGPQLKKLGDDNLPLVNQCVAVEIYSITKTDGIRNMGTSISTFVSRLSIGSRNTSRSKRIDPLGFCKSITMRLLPKENNNHVH